MHQITFKKQVIKALRAMPPREAKRIRDQLSKLAEDPGRRDVDVVELKDRFSPAGGRTSSDFRAR